MAKPEARMRSHRVLICEDDEIAAEMFAAAIRVLGHEVVVCYDGRSSIEAAEEWRPTAAVIDIGLPGVTGYGVAQHIRGLPFGADVLLIAITGYDSPTDIELARHAGFEWHLVKPVRPSVLIDVLRNPQRTPLKGDGSLRH
jgi:two-component system CheB/CheR fusion protein